MRTIGTQAIGVRTPIIREGDNLVEIVAESVLAAVDEGGIQLADRDIIGVTEAVVARAQGNYATVDQIAADVRAKFPSGVVGVVHPILSRNRFAMLLKGIARGADKIILQLAYPSDEVGNHIISLDDMDDKGVNPYSDCFTEAEFRAVFGYETKHKFTGIDYIDYYKSIADNIEIVLASDPTYILKYTSCVIAADIHSRHRTKRRLLAAGAQVVSGLDELVTSSVDGSGFNSDYGLLGSNKASEERVKLFPRDCDSFTTALKAYMLEKTGRTVEIMVYGDGAFKDPVGGIWELADPVVSPSFTEGLNGQPTEIKLKYLADNDFSHLSGEELGTAVKDAVREKNAQNLDLMGKMVTEGTTPRRYTDLLGSLCDLISGSGDKGTPVVLIKGYFDNYAV